nr:MAG TPA: hypothetical protein [Caudoviricetes sp.]
MQRRTSVRRCMSSRRPAERAARTVSRKAEYTLFCAVKPQKMRKHLGGGIFD